MAAMQDTVISLHLNAVWELKSGKVGLVVLAAVVPTIFGLSILSGLCTHLTECRSATGVGLAVRPSWNVLDNVLWYCVDNSMAWSSHH